MIIGNFTKAEDGTFKGVIRTLSIEREAVLTPISEKKGENSPDYRATSGTAGIGAAWKEISGAEKKPYLSVQLDDPAFPATVYCALVKAEQGYALVWSRAKRKRDAQKAPAGTDF
jgi:uncharacterized protein (DUF736 family)